MHNSRKIPNPDKHILIRRRQNGNKPCLCMSTTENNNAEIEKADIITDFTFKTMFYDIYLMCVYTYMCLYA